MNDPIVDEVRRVRDAHAASFGYDLDAIFLDIKGQERKSGHEFVGGVACQGVRSQPLQLTGSEFSSSKDATSVETGPAAEVPG